MRLFRSVILLTILIIAFGSCQYVKNFAKRDIEEETKQNTEEEFKLEKKTGILTVHPEDADAAFLATDDRETVLVISNGQFNLRKYIGRRVEIEGRFQSAAKESFLIEDITRLGREDDVRNIYSHARFGFSIPIIPAWTVTEKLEGIVFTPYAALDDEKIDRISVTRLSNEKKLGIKEWLDLDENLRSRDPADDSFYTEVIIGPDQVPGMKRTSRDGNRIDFYIGRDAAVYRLTHTTIKDEDEDKYRNIFFEMVNNFRFIPMSDSPVVSEPLILPKTDISGQPPGGIPSKFESLPSMTPELPQSTDEKPPETYTEIPPPSSLGASLDSRGLGIVMNYPKDWYWAQELKTVLFSDKPLDEGGTILMELNQRNASSFPEGERDKLNCRLVGNVYFCLSVKDEKFSSLVNPMLGSIGEKALNENQ